MRIKLGIPICLSSLIESCNIEILPPYETTHPFPSRDSYAENESFLDNAIIEYITTDSREVFPSDLFISLVDCEISAEDHMNEARAKGAFALRSRGSIASELSPLEKIAGYYREAHPRLKEIIAITGSAGKTTTKRFTEALLSSAYATHATVGNLNNEIGMPLTILEAPTDTEVLILEMGMNNPSEISRLSRTAKPSIGAITSIGSAHIGKLGSKEAIAKAKLEIVDGIIDGGCLITRKTDYLKPNPGKNINEYTYSYDKEDADACLTPADSGNYIFTINGRTVSLSFFSDTPQILEDLALALSIAYHAGLSPEAMGEAVKHIDEIMLRYSISKIGDTTLIDDAYNSSLDSVKAALAVLSREECAIRSALVGDILEAGEFSEEIHYILGCMLAESVRKLYIVGKMSAWVKRGAIDSGLSAKSIFIIKRSDNISSIVGEVHSLVEKGECILIKASHGIGLYKFKEEYERLINHAE